MSQRSRIVVAAVLTVLAIPFIWRDLAGSDGESTTTTSTTAAAATSSTTQPVIELDPDWAAKGSSRFGASTDGTTTTLYSDVSDGGTNGTDGGGGTTNVDGGESSGSDSSTGEATGGVTPNSSSG